MTVYQASMPANIALIKYMGKHHTAHNIPANPSLSYTLNHLTTTVELDILNSSENSTASDFLLDTWRADSVLSAAEKTKFVRHLDFLRQHFGLQLYFNIHSYNNFPPSCGLASSASSFAALTACAVKAFNVNISLQEQAALSRRGSGSSCRSFFSPWALWEDQQVISPAIFYKELIHCVIVVSSAKKKVSSSDAHHRVQTSLLFSERAQRASIRLEYLLSSFEQRDWEKIYRIIWQEFWDMHGLFHTCAHFFSYLLPETLSVLHYLRTYWQENNDGPLVTMDAGPNVHLLFRPDQKKISDEIQHFFQQHYKII